MSPNCSAALRLAQASLFVHPCNPATKAPRLPSWPTRATNGENEIKYYWGVYGMDSMPGIAMGLCGLVTIDIDVKNGVDGRAAFDRLLDENGELPRCPVTLTPTGGFHLIFRQPIGREPLGNGTGALPPGIDVRGFGGQIIAPGAIRSDGTFYESAPGWPDLCEAYVVGAIPEIPGWIVDLIEQPKRLAAAERGPSGASLPRPRVSSDKTAWAAEGLNQEARALAATGEGSRNDDLYRLVSTFAGHAANGWTTREEVYAAAEWACELNGYLASKKVNDGLKQFNKTFESGWRWGYAHPTSGPRERLTNIDPKFLAGLKPRAA